MKYQVNFFSQAKQPRLEIRQARQKRKIPFIAAGPGRNVDEIYWLAEFDLRPKSDWKFRIDLGHNRYISPENGDYFITSLQTLWVRDGQIFNYRPAPSVSPSQVIRVPAFSGSLPARPLYIYLPRGYNEHIDRFYPVLYMHDGQNCFETFVEDSFAGSWKTEQTADLLIGQGRMRECLIVGIGNGGRERMAEYLPHYINFWSLPPRPLKSVKAYSEYLPQQPIKGRADQTLAYYRYEVAHYLRQHYRVLGERENIATCGSSMGGLFSNYIAWEGAEFARNHAIMSPAYWVTQMPSGKLETIERMRTGQPRDIRLWLDSGTQTAPDYGDDGRQDTIAARDALLENGYVEGPNFQYYLDEGGLHNEATWAARLSLVFQFLFPIS